MEASRQILKNLFDEVEPGQGTFIVDGKWYTPKFGCDTMQEVFDTFKDVFNTQKNTISMEISASLANEKYEHRLRCNGCGKSVSTGVPDHTLVRAWIECPECIEKR